MYFGNIRQKNYGLEVLEAALKTGSVFANFKAAEKMDLTITL